jgi:CheY-like chemotaxis protein
VTAAFSISDAGSAERLRVLLADDQPAMLALTAAVLSSECCVVCSVVDGRELLAEAERLDPDVIVLAVTVPGLDGIEAARQLKRAGCRVKLVFFTVHEYPDYVRGRFARGRHSLRPQRALGLRPHHAIHKALVEHGFVSPMICLEENP